MRAERKNLTQPADLWQAAEAAARAAGQEDDEPLMWVGKYYVVRVTYPEV